MHKTTNILAAAALAVAAPLAASAATVDFDLTRGGDVTANSGTSVVAESGGISLTITGGAPNSATGDVNAWSTGIGMLTDAGRHTIDGRFSEFLVLSFSEAVDLTSLSFSYADAGDNWSVISGMTPLDAGTMSGDGSASSVHTASVNGGVLATQYLIGTNGSASDWKAFGLSVELAPVPLPASGLLLLAGLGGVAAVRRRRNRG